jgi:hypothetical protein
MGGTEILKPMKYVIHEYLINFDYALPKPYTEQIDYFEAQK